MHVNMSSHERSASQTLRLYIACAKFGSSLLNHGVCGCDRAQRGEHTDKHDDSVSLPFIETYGNEDRCRCVRKCGTASYQQERGRTYPLRFLRLAIMMRGFWGVAWISSRQHYRCPPTCVCVCTHLCRPW